MDKTKLRIFMDDVQKINNSLLKPLGGKNKVEFFIGTRKDQWCGYVHVASLKINDVDLWLDRYAFTTEPTPQEIEGAENHMYLNLIQYLLLYRFPVWEEVSLSIRKNY